MPKRIEFEGTVHEFPDDFTDEDIAAALGGPARSWADTAKDVAIGAAKGVGDTVVGLGNLVHKIPGVTGAVDAMYGQPGLSENSFQVADKELEATNAPQMVGKAAEFGAEFLIPVTKVGQAAKAMLPSRARAGAKFEQVMQHAKDVPVDVGKTGDVALRVQELADRGASMPQVVRKFLRRTTDPAQGPMTYSEARDFYSNISRLSADEFKRMTPVVQREVAQMREALDKALYGAADTVGRGADYLSAMTEYGRASKGRKAVDAVKDTAVKAGITGAAGGTLYLLAKKLGLAD